MSTHQAFFPKRKKKKKKKKKIKPWLEKTKNLNHFKSTISTMVDE